MFRIKNHNKIQISRNKTIHCQPFFFFSEKKNSVNKHGNYFSLHSMTNIEVQLVEELHNFLISQ